MSPLLSRYHMPVYRIPGPCCRTLAAEQVPGLARIETDLNATSRGPKASLWSQALEEGLERTPISQIWLKSTEEETKLGSFSNLLLCTAAGFRAEKSGDVRTLSPLKISSYTQPPARGAKERPHMDSWWKSAVDAAEKAKSVAKSVSLKGIVSL